MGNFEKLSVLVIVVIIVMILVVALYTWTDNPDSTAGGDSSTTSTVVGNAAMSDPPVAATSFPAAPPANERARLPIISPSPANGAVPPVPPVLAPNPMTGAIEPRPATVGTEAPKVETPTEPRVHVVASGDNLTKISKKYFNSTAPRYIDAISRANPGLDPNRLRVNQKLQIPSDVAAATPTTSDGSLAIQRPSTEPMTTASGPKAGSVYTVRRGDRLPDIARRAYGSSENWHLIWLENFTTIRDPDAVPSGTKLKIPHVN